MTEHQRETAFLRRITLFDKADECRKLDERIAEVQDGERCLQRATWLMALFTGLAAAGLAYGVILQENFPYDESSVIRVICEVGLASLICLVAFAGVLALYRNKLNQLLKECRQQAANLPESQPNRPHFTSLQGSQPFIHPAIETVESLNSDDLSRFEGEGGSEAPVPAAELIDVPLESAIWRRPRSAPHQTNLK